MPRRHIETRNIVFHIGTVASGSLRMMKTEISTNGEAPIEAREHRRATITQDHKRTGSAHLDEPSNRSGEEKMRSLFRRPGVIVAAAALAIAESVMAALSCFIHSLTKQPTMRSSMCTQFLWRQKLPAMWQWCVWTTINWSKKAMFWSRSIRAIFKSHWRRPKRTWQETRTRKYKQN